MSDQDPGLLSGRYQLRNQIARGGMTDVFLATDTLLSRSVAVKRLFSEFSTDQSFVERFRREATAAANLSHPNIVSVYDWGQDESTYYIVMEYLEGHSVAELLRSGGPLPPDRAAEIVIDVAAALGFAHENGVIHRDVKPSNILLSPDGQVKVTDFGIAIAVSGGTESNLTQTGAVMGTATYFSPEQAQGHPVDARSDLYSLGVVLYELVCGRPPFSGDSSVAIAYKHVQQTPPSLSSLGVNLPESLEAITMKLLAKDPADRYPTAADLQRDLQRYREGQHRLASRPQPDQQPDPASSSNGPPSSPTPSPILTVEPSSRAGLYTVAAVTFIAVAVLLVFVLNSVLGGNGDSSDPVVAETPVADVEVPNVVDMAEDAAVRTLESLEFTVRLEFEASDTVSSDLVISQDPAASTELARDSEVVLTISSGPVPVSVPGVVGQPGSDAARSLQESGFSVELRVIEGSTAPEGQVLSQDPPASTEVAPGTTVVLDVSEGPQSIEVPEVTGLTEIQATQFLVQAGLTVDPEVIGEPSAEVGQGLVTGTNPMAGTILAPGITVIIMISTGPPEVTVPNLVGLAPDVARQLLGELGLLLTDPLVDCDFPNNSEQLVGRIMDQVPSAGEVHPPQTQVIACIGRPLPFNPITDFTPRPNIVPQQPQFQVPTPFPTISPWGSAP